MKVSQIGSKFLNVSENVANLKGLKCATVHKEVVQIKISTCPTNLVCCFKYTASFH